MSDSARASRAPGTTLLTLKPFNPVAIRGLLVVAALGRSERFHIVRENLKRFDHTAGNWDCLLYAHSAQAEAESQSFKLSTGKSCTMQVRLGWKWASLLNLTTPSITYKYTHVFVLLDDILLPSKTFNLARLLQLQESSEMAMISPSIVGASRLEMQPPHRSELGSNCVRQVKNVIEIFATSFRVKSWECLHEMFNNDVLHTSSEAIGWGYDLCYLAHCSSRGLGRIGVVESLMAVHTEGPVSELNFVDRRKNVTTFLGKMPGLPWIDDTLLSANRAMKKLEKLEEFTRSAKELIAGYRAEMDTFVAALNGSRRLSLIEGDLSHIGMRQARRLAKWVRRHDGKRCFPPLPRVEQPMKIYHRFCSEVWKRVEL